MEKLPWVEEIERLRNFQKEVERLVEKTEEERGPTHIFSDYALNILLTGLKTALADKKPTRYTKTYRGGCGGLEEVCDGIILE